MSPVFGHGRLRIYILKLLDESPRHGYDVIRLLEDRFMGLYSPSAGTVYPRLAKLEAEGLVTHDEEGGRKVYRLTDAGRAELATLSNDLRELEEELVGSIKDLAAEVRNEVRGSVRSLRDELKGAAKDARRQERSEARPMSRELRDLERELERLRTEVRLLSRREGVKPESIVNAHHRIHALLEELRTDLGGHA
jgi:DNA-binding PadR family transcriptional regulator